MNQQGLKAQYEADKIPFVKQSSYLPDWKIRENVYVETKGYFSPANRGNLLAFRQQHPHITIHLLFQEPYNVVSTRAKKPTTYAKWAEDNGFLWSSIDRPLPEEWWKEQ
jgi:hypothetical protein